MSVSALIGVEYDATRAAEMWAKGVPILGDVERLTAHDSLLLFTELLLSRTSWQL